jgi:hypothetical protein
MAEVPAHDDITGAAPARLAASAPQPIRRACKANGRRPVRAAGRRAKSLRCVVT